MISEGGENTVLNVAGGQASLAGFANGLYEAVIVDEIGNVLTQITIEIGDKIEETPSENQTEEKPNEKQEETPQTPIQDEETQEQETPKKVEESGPKDEEKNTSVWLILSIVLVVLVGVGVVTVLLIKKQKAKSKTKKK